MGEMDRDIVSRARQGDHAAFSELARGSIGHLTAVARLILHDEYLAQDAVQDALVDAWRDLRGLRDPDRFEAWLYRILVRSCHSRARREWRRDVIEIQFDGPAHDIAGRDSGSPLETRDQLNRALGQLSHEHRAALVVTYYLDLSLKEGAAVLGIPLGTMKSRVNRASGMLRAVIEADDRAAPAAVEQFA